MKIFTYFDRETWASTGKNWLQLAGKSRLKDVNVFFSSLSSEEETSLIGVCSDLGFNHQAVDSVSFLSVCKIVSNKLLDSRCDSGLLLSPSINPSFVLSDSKDAFCHLLADPQIDLDIVSSIFNIKQRYEAVLKLEKVKELYGGFLDSSLIFGTADFWHSFAGFQKYLNKNNFFESLTDRYGDLVLNLFFHSADSFSLETKK